MSTRLDASLDADYRRRCAANRELRAELADLRVMLDTCRAALQPFANIAEYRVVREQMAKALHPHEQVAFQAALIEARRVLSLGMKR